MKYVRGNFWPAVRFGDDADLNRQALAWCDDPEGLMDQEHRHLGMLSRVKFYRNFGDQLALLTDEGEHLLFQAK